MKFPKMLSLDNKIIYLQIFNLGMNLSLISNKAPNLHPVFFSEMDTALIKNNNTVN